MSEPHFTRTITNATQIHPSHTGGTFIESNYRKISFSRDGSSYARGWWQSPPPDFHISSQGYPSKWNRTFESINLPDESYEVQSTRDTYSPKSRGKKKTLDAVWVRSLALCLSSRSHLRWALALYIQYSLQTRSPSHCLQLQTRHRLLRKDLMNLRSRWPILLRIDQCTSLRHTAITRRARSKLPELTCHTNPTHRRHTRYTTADFRHQL